MLLQSNALKIPLADKSVHCVVTSPPYWGLRDYGISDQLGLEPTPERYVENMVAVFREVWRVLRRDGTVWLNLGDSYGTGTTASRQAGTLNLAVGTNNARQINRAGGQAKQLQGIPWRVALALQADGWWLRSDIIWHKPNPMPESVTDRPTKAHEYLFLLSKSKKYYSAIYPKRNKRTVWTIPTYSYKGAHFATFPPALVEPCVKAGTSERGCCPECGSPWEVEPTKDYAEVLERNKIIGNHALNENSLITGVRGQAPRKNSGITAQYTTISWQPACDHDHDPVPCTVLDPFAGSGTTLQVARALGRNSVGLDLSAEYLQLARQRLELDKLEAWAAGNGKGDIAELTDLPMFREKRG